MNREVLSCFTHPMAGVQQRGGKPTVGRKTRSLRQEQLQLSEELRSRRDTWPAVADAFRRRYHVNARTALRLARGWSQREAAEQWNERWPADLKTFKNFSYWETWPAPSGYEPSLSMLSKLAELYECSVADLLVDGADYRARDRANRVNQNLDQLRAATHRVAKSEQDGNGTSPTFTATAGRLEKMDMVEISRTAATWAQRINSPAIDRRGVLLKLAAGISIAAGAPAFAAETDRGDPGSRANTKLEGIWLSRYVYHSTSRRKDFAGEHYVVLRQQKDQIVGESLLHSTGSELRMELSIDGSIASGTWTERTSPTGYYRGATYHGTIQLLINPLARDMSGQWIGFGKDFKINNGEWSLTWASGNLAKRDLQRYKLAL